MNLPERFLKDVKEILGEEFDDFIKSYNQKKTTAIRVNTMKIEKDKLKNILNYNMEDIPWSEEGFYYDEDLYKPGKNPLHDAGAYYMQEPSAMSVVPKADIREGEKVLDMCAAPGGKSTYILSKLNNTGILVSNEINNTRIKALGENIERFGSANSIITNIDSKGLLKVFRGYFDKVIIDAPCSGEGMFRKDENAILDWNYSKVIECRDIQYEIIRDGYKMLKNGGTLVYSTCTFSIEENEEIIDGLKKEYENAEIVLKERLWPHKIKGEGHFVAKIIKHDDEECSTKVAKFKKIDKELKLYREFENKFMNIKLDGEFFVRGENIYLMPKDAPDTKKLKLLRQGLHLGELKKNRFEPSHALAHYLNKNDVKNFADFKFDSNEIKSYMSGDIINTGESRGWIIVGVEGISLGWGKESGGVIKNRYPKGLRRKVQL